MLHVIWVKKKFLWEELHKIKVTHQLYKCCLWGDFNAVRSTNVRKGIGTRDTQQSDIERFNCFVEDNILLELPVTGRKYMWYKPNGTTKSRLDRVLVSDEWLKEWPNSKQYIKARKILTIVQ